MNPEIEKSLAAFNTISLKALETKAEMLDRIDNKYIVTGQQLQPAFAALTEYFDVLEIDARRAFQYSTRYFDDVERSGYYDHHQRKRKRSKARIRRYVDAGLNFLEVKTNEQRGMTAKRRLRIEKPLKLLDDRCLDFIDSCCQESYDELFEKNAIPVIVIEYQRITLVAKQGGERLTIDTHMRFTSETASCAAPAEMFIVETKSKRGNGLADKVMRSLHIQPTKRVSKYCISLVVTGQVSRRNGFLPALRRLRLVDPVVTPAINFHNASDKRTKPSNGSVSDGDAEKRNHNNVTPFPARPADLNRARRPACQSS